MKKEHGYAFGVKASRSKTLDQIEYELSSGLGMGLAWSLGGNITPKEYVAGIETRHGSFCVMLVRGDLCLETEDDLYAADSINSMFDDPVEDEE